ncbi:MAG: anhydro-N-acetylmuramic acid kinase [Gammaproteobacteria bacterium]|nr:MAG: anhydro-N-acetylmuramic acid kinase [Gammaproteobacteria bacterium]
MNDTRSDLYIGVMSGTSHDGIDAALIEFHGSTLRLVATAYSPFTHELRTKLLKFNRTDTPCLLDEVLPAGREFSAAVANTVQSLLSGTELQPDSITAIGCHGHTLRHQPDGEYGYSYQLIDGAALAVSSNIPVVCDFRSADIALGGTGAPLAPAFHQFLFHSPDENRVILNIGGISNITLLGAAKDTIRGFDTGPGNLLMDFWMERHFGQRYDNLGNIARQGTVNKALLQQLLTHPFFSTPPPKSTGREAFNGTWLLEQGVSDFDRHDIMATLVELTATTVATAISWSELTPGTILVCGGGSHNNYLIDRIAALATPWKLETTAVLGLDADWVEAAAFAWLAQQRWQQQPGNLPNVTGARRDAILGAVYLP